MNDRELLELAAKAAGIELVWHNFSNVPSLFKGLSSDEVWNPLTDDGDALRLAVKCKIDLVFVTQYHDHAEVVFVGDGEVKHELSGDPLAATRRAIVRAAAEIGKGV